MRSGEVEPGSLSVRSYMEALPIAPSRTNSSVLAVILMQINKASPASEFLLHSVPLFGAGNASRSQDGRLGTFLFTITASSIQPRYSKLFRRTLPAVSRFGKFRKRLLISSPIADNRPKKERKEGDPVLSHGLRSIGKWYVQVPY